MELAFRLPASVKVRNGSTKWVLKEVARSLLPGDVIDRKKVGFGYPSTSGSVLGCATRPVTG